LADEKSLQEYKARLQKVIDHVEKNIADKLSLDTLAEVSCFSPYHFHRVFHAFVGEAPGEFVNRIRLEKAASRLITSPAEGIAQIAFECGFASSSSFARAFRVHFGCSASDWRVGRLEELMNRKSRNENRGRQETFAMSRYCADMDSKSAIERIEEMLSKTEIKLMPSFHVAYITRQHGDSERIEKLFDKLRRWAGMKGLLTEETRFLGIELNNPKVTAPDKSRYYACVTVPTDIAPEQEIGITNIAASRCATAHFEGAQNEIAPAYDELFRKFLPENGYQPADMPAYEIYYDNSRKIPGKEFSLDLCVPVENWKPCQSLEP
jgi:AraC family transcriptional regulator